jgi:mono/diheme cytochrome c family protein
MGAWGGNVILHSTLARRSLLAGLVVVAGAPDAASAADPRAADLYASKCRQCHFVEGKAPIPQLSLADGEWKHGSSLAEVSKVISEGVKGTAMQPFKDRLGKEEIEALARYVRSFDSKLAAGDAKGRQP